eukprot:764462-Hanusia_phi.AAC.3
MQLNKDHASSLNPPAEIDCVVQHAAKMLDSIRIAKSKYCLRRKRKAATSHSPCNDEICEGIQASEK